MAFFNTPVVKSWIVELFGVFDQPHAQLYVQMSWIYTPVFDRIWGEIQQYKGCMQGSPNKTIGKIQPVLNMWNTVSVLVRYST
jgi:hypothetical protein